ncbi:MAG: hypothetical protein N2439_11490, partial [Anaerolineae bacterium]|nr:hypothetical protein [Anaerolineae bacterium]
MALTLDAGPVQAAGLEAGTFGLTARIKEDRADIDRLMVTDLAGASLSATASLTDLSRTPSGTLDASIVSADGAELFSALAARFPGAAWLADASARVQMTPDLLSDLQLSIIAASAPEEPARAFTVSGNVRAASGSASFSANWNGLDGGLGALEGEWQVTATQDEPLNFLSLAGIDLVPLGAPGPATLELKASGNPDSALEIDLAYSADGTTASFSGIRRNGPEGAVLDGRAVLSSTDVDPYLLATGLAFPGTGLGTPVSLETQLVLSRSSHALNQLTAAVSGLGAAGNLAIARSGDRPAISGSLSVDRADAGWMLEMIGGPASLQPDAQGRFAAAFSANPGLPADGRIRLSARSFDLGPAGTVSAAEADVAFDAASIRIEKFEGRLAGGTLSGTLAGTNQDGTVTIGGDFALRSAQTGQLIASPGVSGQVDVSGTVSASGKTVDGLAASLTGSGAASLSGASIDGVNPGGLAPFLALPLTEGKAPDEAAVRDMIERHVFSGSMPFGTATAAWTAASGKVRVPGFRATSGSAGVEADIEADVASQKVSVRGRVTYDAGRQALAGAETVVPFSVTR